MRLQIDTFEIINKSMITSVKPNIFNNEVSNDPFEMQADSSSQNHANWWKYLCSSYCRIQLFRLKGAQRKLKTDRLKIDRLNPLDLKRRYQSSDSATVLYNCGFDNLYSLFPLDRIELAKLQPNYKQLKQTPNPVTAIQKDTFCTIQVQSNSGKNVVEAAKRPNSSFYLNNTSPFSCESEYSNNKSNSNTNETLQYYLENNSYNFNEITNKFGAIKELTIDDLNSVIDDDSDLSLSNVLSPIRSNSLSFTTTKIDPDVKNSNQQISSICTLASPGTSSQNINKTQIPSSTSLPHELSLLGSNHQQIPINTNEISTTTIAARQLYSSQVTVVAENRSTQQITTLPNLSLKTDLTSKHLTHWLVTNRFTHLITIFQNYSTNDFLRLSKDDLIKLCGAPDAIRCYNLAHNIQICPRLTLLVKFAEQSYFSAIYLTDCKCKNLIKRLIQFYNSHNKKQILGNVNSVISQGATSENVIKNSCNNESNENFEIYMKFKGALIKITDEVLSNVNSDTKFILEFAMNQEAINNNKNLMVFESDCDYMLKNTNQTCSSLAIIMIPID